MRKAREEAVHKKKQKKEKLIQIISMMSELLTMLWRLLIFNAAISDICTQQCVSFWYLCHRYYSLCELYSETSHLTFAFFIYAFIAFSRCFHKSSKLTLTPNDLRTVIFCIHRYHEYAYSDWYIGFLPFFFFEKLYPKSPHEALTMPPMLESEMINNMTLMT